MLKSENLGGDQPGLSLVSCTLVFMSVVTPR
jgi:hypothetical protein